jgi:hypothetical protein
VGLVVTETPFEEGWRQYASRFQAAAEAQAHTPVSDEVMRIQRLTFYAGAVWYRALLGEGASTINAADHELHALVETCDL